MKKIAYDALGRVQGVNDSAGLPLTSDLGLPTSAIENRFLWQGREYSWNTGLYNFRARWYDPITGRWLSNDPIGISGGLNQYVFCGDNPVNFVDPWGLIDWLGDKAKALGGQLARTKHGAAKIAAVEAAEKRNNRTVTVTTDPAVNNSYDAGSRTVNLSGELPLYRSGEELIISDPREILNHELDHALFHFGTDSDGMAAARREMPGDMLHSVLERHAVEDTNLLRQELGRNPRTKYSTEPGRWINGIKWPEKPDGYGGWCEGGEK